MALADSEPAVLETETYRPYHYTTVDSTERNVFVLHSHFESVLSPSHYVQCLTLITITFLRSFKMS